MPIEDGIHAAKLQIKRGTWFDRDNCAQLLEALRFYHRKYDPKNRMFRSTIQHDWSSHAADAWRYCSLAQREPFEGNAAPQQIAMSTYNPLETRV
jgi:hypothetical protein